MMAGVLMPGFGPPVHMHRAHVVAFVAHLFHVPGMSGMIHLPPSFPPYSTRPSPADIRGSLNATEMMGLPFEPALSVENPI